MNFGHTFLFHKNICTVFFSDNEYNAMISPHIAQRKHAFLVKATEKSKSQKQIPKRKVSLELLHQRLGHRSTRSLLDRYAENVWKYVELKVHIDLFCTLCQISTINKKDISKTTLKSKIRFKQVLMNIIPATSSKSLTKFAAFYNNLLTVDAYYKIPKLYGMENIITEEVMEK